VRTEPLQENLLESLKPLHVHGRSLFRCSRSNVSLSINSPFGPSITWIRQRWRRSKCTLGNGRLFAGMGRLGVAAVGVFVANPTTRSLSR
jgi:hypothetical protein